MDETLIQLKGLNARFEYQIFKQENKELYKCEEDMKEAFNLMKEKTV